MHVYCQYRHHHSWDRSIQHSTELHQMFWMGIEKMLWLVEERFLHYHRRPSERSRATRLGCCLPWLVSLSSKGTTLDFWSFGVEGFSDLAIAPRRSRKREGKEGKEERYHDNTFLLVRWNRLICVLCVSLYVLCVSGVASTKKVSSVDIFAQKQTQTHQT